MLILDVLAPSRAVWRHGLFISLFQTVLFLKAAKCAPGSSLLVFNQNGILESLKEENRSNERIVLTGKA